MACRGSAVRIRLAPSAVRAAADCLRTLGFEQDKNQIRTSEGRVTLWRKK